MRPRALVLQALQQQRAISGRRHVVPYGTSGARIGVRFCQYIWLPRGERHTATIWVRLATATYGDAERPCHTVDATWQVVWHITSKLTPPDMRCSTDQMCGQRVDRRWRCHLHSRPSPAGCAKGDDAPKMTCAAGGNSCGTLRALRICYSIIRMQVVV